MSPMDKLLDEVDWKPTGLKSTNEDLPYATHTGQIHLGPIELDVVQLNDGRRIITEDSLKKLFRTT